jgi:mycofactocin precursor
VAGTTETKEVAMNPELEQDDELVAEDLIEEVSIDGMCGVY